MLQILRLASTRPFPAPFSMAGSLGLEATGTEEYTISPDVPRAVLQGSLERLQVGFWCGLR